jgi:UDP-N-acetylmuramoylalanine--D-glutamate ligase
MEHWLVLGLGVSGEAAARLLLKEGVAVTVIDRADDDRLRLRAEALRQDGAEVYLGTESLPNGPFSLAVASPGLPEDSPWMQALESAGTEVTSELELGASRSACPILAITGTNGKSTLTTLCRDALKNYGLKVEMAGNIGIPISSVVQKTRELDWLVVEVSSFQLEQIRMFHPKIAVLLNIQPDHLNRHGSMEAYKKAKFRIFKNMGAGDTGVVLETWAGEVPTSQGLEWLKFGVSDACESRYRPGEIRFLKENERFRVDVTGTLFDNPVLGLTAAAAVAAVYQAVDGRPDCLSDTFSDFHPLPHRMEWVTTINGVKFINDSKATNLAAVQAALEMTEGPVRLIAGGLLKEKKLNRLQESLVKKVRGVYSIGKASNEMVCAWGTKVPCRPCETLDRAVRMAWKDAASGETILLSPGCASFDQFLNFEERGLQFIKEVRLIDEET